MKNDRKDDRKDDTDERRKGNGSRERKTVLVDGRLLRPCVSRSFPLNSSANGSGERSTHEERECERMESQDDARERRGESESEREREIRTTRREVQERTGKHYAGWHDCVDAAREK